MHCPNCNVTTLIIQNNNYFCPRCKIYIGSVKDHPQGFPSPAPFAATNQVIQDAPIKASRSENFKYFISAYILPGFIASFLIGLYFLLPNFFHYLSLSPYCNIKLEEKKTGFKANVTQALDLIRGQDQTKYHDICRYVSTIAEGPCPVSDEGESGTINTKLENHCYIKGSKVIYLNNLGDLELAADLSRDFWEKSR